MDSNYSAVIVYREGEDGREYMVLEYDSGEGIQVKFPGGTNVDHPGETPVETAHRELRTETGLVMTRDPDKIWNSLPKPDRKNGGVHIKHAFMISLGECAGVMRTDFLNDDGDRLSPPFWKTEAELLVDVSTGGLFWTHREMLHVAKIS